MTRRTAAHALRQIAVVISAAVLGLASAFVMAVVGLLPENLSFFAIPVLSATVALLLNRGLPHVEK